MNYLDDWQNICEAVKNDSNINAASWRAFIKPLEFISENDGYILLKTTTLIKNTVETKYINIIEKYAKQILNRDVIIKLTDNDNNNPSPSSLKIISKNGISSNYTFDNFIVGESNQFAYAACMVVAESPGAEYNPLFIHGSSGLGKTHLLHSIANYILEKNPDYRIAYITCEKFTNELINSIRNKDNENFRQRYRNLDVLLIDDIQFINGKESTQDEFFHTFNALYNENKQIIIASDRPPEEIKTLTSRLRSRFRSGLLADVKPPDYETRVAILQKKCDEQNIDIEEDVISYIAHKVNTNIRELLGAFTNVTAYRKLFVGADTITLEIAEKALNNVSGAAVNEILSIDKIQQIVCDTFGIQRDDLISKKRNKPLSTYRQIAEYLCRKYLKSTTLTEIAQNFGGQNHTSVRTAVDKIQTALSNNEKDICKLVSEVEYKIVK